MLSILLLWVYQSKTEINGGIYEEKTQKNRPYTAVF